MKKLSALIVSAILFLSITACSPKSEVQDTMIVKPSEISEETTSVLKLFDEEIMFFDFIVDKTVKSSAINVWVYKNGEWVDSGASQGNIDNRDNKIAIKVTGSGYDLFSIDETGHVKYSAPEMDSSFDDTKQQVSSKVTNPTNIVIGQEIPLWVKIGNNKNGISISENFRNSDCTEESQLLLPFQIRELNRLSIKSNPFDAKIAGL